MPHDPPSSSDPEASRARAVIAGAAGVKWAFQEDRVQKTRTGWISFAYSLL